VASDAEDLEKAVTALGENPGVEGRKAERPAIISMDATWTYQVPGSDPVLVLEAEDKVLQAFLQHGPCLEWAKLCELIGENAPKALRKLVKKYNGCFAPAIRLPGKKGQGAYYVNIRRS
jgi:hypothetical protein